MAPVTVTLFPFLLIVFLNSCVSSDAHDGSAAVRLDSTSFQQSVEKGPHFVMFFAPWCGHCKRLAPTWEELAEKYNAKSEDRREVTIAKVDCTTETALCSEQDVTGYPTLKFFKPGESTSQRYRGSRELNALAEYVKEQLGNKTTSAPTQDEVEVPKAEKGLVELTEQNFRKFVENGNHFVKFYAPWCGHCQKLAPIWEELAESLQHDNSIEISKVDCTAHRSVCQEYEVKGYPTLIWIRDGKKVDRYQGSRSHEDLKAFVTKMKGQDETQTEDTDDDEEKEAAHHDEKQSTVVELTADNFENGISQGTSFVMFYAPWCGHCNRLKPTWEELGKKFVGDPNVKIARVDCTANKNRPLCKENKVNGYPTVYIFKNGKQIEEYKSSRELADLHAYVMSHASRDEL